MKFWFARDPLLHSERTQGFAADPDYWKGEVFAYVGLPQNLKDLKDHQGSPGSSVVVFLYHTTCGVRTLVSGATMWVLIKAPKHHPVFTRASWSPTPLLTIWG